MRMRDRVAVSMGDGGCSLVRPPCALYDPSGAVSLTLARPSFFSCFLPNSRLMPL